MNTEFPFEEGDEEAAYRDALATVDASGKRIWIYPKKPKGKFFQYRTLVSYLLLVVLFGLPWIQLNGEPFVMFNVLKRHFIIFGIHFAPQDFYLFVIGMLIMMLFIVVFTVIFGRLFCGWVCPQTIFMEMVYRRIEYWIEGDASAQRKLANAPWDSDKLFKKVGKQIIFFSIAVLIANTFLAYIIGMDEVLKIILEPVSEHWTGFIAMIIFSFVFYFVFASLREQVCTTICPYGRLQGVLLDKSSLAVYYDWIRGEPRGKLKKNESQEEKGDCIDCKLCVHVCPTGIDIRNGIQLECVNCTACMDACDEVMTKIDKPQGLIRIDSYNGIKDKKSTLLTPRALAYCGVLAVLMILETFLFLSRSEVETLLLRTPGILFQELPDGRISNLYNYQLINKTADEFPIRMEVENIPAEIEWIGNQPSTAKNDIIEGALFIKIAADQLTGRKTELKVKVISEIDGKVVDHVNTNFLGPVK
jgi:cytochrome c oxidase accessory protein FixG